MMAKQSPEQAWARVEEIVAAYHEQVRTELYDRLHPWKTDLSRRAVQEVIGALLARQTTLGMQMARSPGVWNAHIAPVILRTMVDTFISLAWILEEPDERARRFILHGLGQIKLNLEHRAEEVRKDGGDPEDDPIIRGYTNWLNSQRFDFLTEVDIGSWSGLSTREMAEEADCLDLYRYAYAPFSAATHSMWHHIAIYNLVPCRSPLHKLHRLPSVSTPGPDVDYLYRAAKYVEKSFRWFEEAQGFTSPERPAFTVLKEDLETLGEEWEQEIPDGAGT